MKWTDRLMQMQNRIYKRDEVDEKKRKKVRKREGKIVGMTKNPSSLIFLLFPDEEEHFQG